jgi:hypothetical protein
MGGSAMREEYYVVWDEYSPNVFHSSLPLIYLLPRLKGKEYMRFTCREDALLASSSPHDDIIGYEDSKILKIEL